MLLKSEREIQGLVKKKEIPCKVINDRLLFNKQQIIEWALSRNITLNLSDHENMSEYHVKGLHLLLDDTSFYYNCSLNESTYIEQMVALLHLETSIDRDVIVQLLKNREALLSTAIGNGISLPHPRIPLMMGGDKPLIAFFFPEQPLALNAIDGEPVHTLILLISQTIKQHLSLLAHLGFLLSDPGFRLALKQRLSYTTMLDTIVAIESRRAV